MQKTMSENTVTFFIDWITFGLFLTSETDIYV